MTLVGLPPRHSLRNASDAFARAACVQANEQASSAVRLPRFRLPPSLPHAPAIRGHVNKPGTVILNPHSWVTISCWLAGCSLVP